MMPVGEKMNLKLRIIVHSQQSSAVRSDLKTSFSFATGMKEDIQKVI